MISPKREDFGRFFDYLSSLSAEKPVFKTFKTDSGYYLYDAGTNKILRCTDVEYEVINAFFDGKTDPEKRHAVEKLAAEGAAGLKRFVSSVQKENVLQTKKASQFGLSSHFKNLDELMSNSLKMLQLETTEKCNLRCAYCIYNASYEEKRSHGSKDMSVETARKAVNHLERNSRGLDDVTITFYGGEPLLNMRLIREIVRYSHDLMNKKSISHSLTTNAVLINEDIAGYFRKNNFGVVVSIDGPRSVHDGYRKKKNGKGSFDDTLRGLRTLCRVFEKDAGRLSLSMVFAPPYNEERIEEVCRLWKRYPWLPDDLGVIISYPSAGSVPHASCADKNDLNFNLFDWAAKRFYNDFLSGRKSHPIVNSIIERKMAMLMKRPLYHQPTGKYHLNGCCLPAVRKLFVTTSGEFAMCERIGNAPSLGNVHDGINAGSLKNFYVDEYSRKSLADCSDCWAIRLCNLCYIHAVKNEKIDLDMKRNYCAVTRAVLENELALFCKILEINDQGLDRFKKWEFV